MRVALVHDYLNQYGGGERVLETLMEIFPEAPIYTLLYDKEKTLNRFDNRVKKTSFLDFPLACKYHRPFIPLMPLASQTMTIDHDYDLVISDSAGFAKGINITCHRHSNCHGPKHASYIHTPLRYAWEQENYLSGLIFPADGGTPPSLFYKFLFGAAGQFLISKPILTYLKKWDYKAGQKPDALIANSNFIAEKIKRYYGREAKVIYPAIDLQKFYYSLIRANEPPTYYLAVGRMLHYKKFDLIIDAFAELGLPLKIVGSGPEYQNLELRIKNYELGNIELLPFVEDENQLRMLYGGARALIFPQVEDFGLVAAEAQACGTPVIAYAAGGALEIVEDGKTGVLFKEQTPASLVEAIRRFEKMKFNRAKISKMAQKFSKENFKKEFLTFIAAL
jgi:glycosyltransferase involved in cell wall biosynthesis